MNLVCCIHLLSIQSTYTHLYFDCDVVEVALDKLVEKYKDVVSDKTYPYFYIGVRAGLQNGKGESVKRCEDAKREALKEVTLYGSKEMLTVVEIQSDECKDKIVIDKVVIKAPKYTPVDTGKVEELFKRFDEAGGAPLVRVGTQKKVEGTDDWLMWRAKENDFVSDSSSSEE